jgi:hypothetical protein
MPAWLTRVPTFWLATNGHALERQVRGVYPQLNVYERNLGYTVIARAFGDLPGFVPSSVVDMFRQIVTPSVQGVASAARLNSI